jgi:CheY-like chemotaxis protein
MKDFLDSKPQAEDFIAIYDNYGPSAFNFLYRVPRWSDNPLEQKQAREYVEKIVTAAESALDQHIRNPQRIAKYIANLGATPEERVYAQAELLRIGAVSVPYMVEQIRNDKDPAIIAGIYGIIPQMDPESVAAWIAALDGLNPSQQYGVISALVRHQQFASLQDEVQTSLIGYLWRLVLPQTQSLPELKILAGDVLRQYYRGDPLFDKREPARELLAIARQFYTGQPRYRLVKNDPSGTSVVSLWRWSNSDNKLVAESTPLVWANEYYGLRYARWAASPNSPVEEDAQVLILCLLGKSAILRCGYDDLLQHNPAALQLLVTAPPAVRAEACRQALRQKQTATLVALLQAAQLRADKDLAAAPLSRPASRPTLLEAALDYPDPLVQLLAADTMLRAPWPLTSASRLKIVDILRRQLQDAHSPPPAAPGTALYVEPNPQRRDRLLPTLAAAGFRVETFATGRELLQRLQQGTADLIVIDRHVVQPLLCDLLSQLQTDPRWAGIPTLVLASPDQLPTPTLEQLLLRVAVLMVATDQELPIIPNIYVPNPEDPPERRNRDKTDNQLARDRALLQAATERRTRLWQIVSQLPLLLTPEQRRFLELRVDWITYAILAAQYPISAEVAPQTMQRIEDIRQQLALSLSIPRPDTRLAVEELLRLIQRLEVDLDRVPAARDRFETLYSQLDPESLGLPIARYRDTDLKASLRRQLEYFPHIPVVFYPATATEIREDWFPLWQFSTVQKTATPAFKRGARLRAVSALAQLASHAEANRDLTPAIPALLVSLSDDELAPHACDALLHLADPSIQPALIALARNGQRPLPLRQLAADYAIRHAQRFSPTLAPEQVASARQAAQDEPDPLLRLRLLTYLDLAAAQPAEFRRELLNYQPPLPNPAPAAPKPDK